MIDMIQNLMGLLTSGATLYMLGGVLLGMIFGAIPGLTGTLAVIILIPMTYKMTTGAGVALLIGAYVGGMSGGFVSSIMLNMPGTPSDVATCYDGFPLAQQGKAGRAMGVGILANLAGSIFGWIALLFFGGILSKVAMSFGVFETTAAILFGFTAVISLGGVSISKSLISALLGLTLCCIGYDTGTGVPRATFGSAFLKSGFDYMPVMIGMFVLTEILSQVEQISNKYVVPKQEFTNLWPNIGELVKEIPNLVRSCFIGVAIGMLPGIGGSFSNFVSYDQAKKHSRNPEEYGHGAIGGIIATQACTKATIGGALVPFIALGIPGDTITAALLGGLMIKGITPGPLFAMEHPDTANTIYNSVLLAGVLVFLIMITIGLKFFPQILRLPKYILLPVVTIFALVGTYNMNFAVSDVWVAIIFAVFGFLMDKFGIPKTPLVVAMILGPNFESKLRSAISLGKGSLLPFITRPYSLIFILATIFTVVFPLVRKVMAQKNLRAEET